VEESTELRGHNPSRRTRRKMHGGRIALLHILLFASAFLLTPVTTSSSVQACVPVLIGPGTPAPTLSPRLVPTPTTSPTDRDVIPRAFKNADAVFRGIALRVDDDANPYTAIPQRAHFKVETVWKGNPSEQTVILVTSNLTDCDVSLYGMSPAHPFIAGRAYIVYARMGRDGLEMIEGTKEATVPPLEDSVLGHGSSPNPDYRHFLLVTLVMVGTALVGLGCVIAIARRRRRMAMEVKAAQWERERKPPTG
jgi:hypothetical protein